jgi:putative inorganic carbon (HCO3(-)) transporter
MLWIWIALSSPSTYLFGFAASLPLNKIAVGVALISLLVDQNKKKPYFDAHMVLLLLFIAQGTISYSYGLSDLERPYDLLDKMWKVGALCLFMTMANRERLQIHSIVAILCLGIGVHGALEGAKYVYTGGASKVWGPASIGDNNYLAMATLFIIPLLVYLGRYSAVRLIRGLFLGATVASVVGVIATASRGGLVGLGVLGVLTILQSRRKFLSLIAVAILGAGLAAFVPAQWTERMNTIGEAGDDGSFMSRVSSWKLHTILALDRPFLGGGYSALESEPVFKLYRTKFHAMDFIDSPEPTTPLAAHSIYFQTLGDLGFPGLLLFLGILLVAFHNTGRILRLTRGNESRRWAGDLAVMVRLSLIVYMVCGALLSAAYFEIIYILLTVVSMLRRHLEETSSSLPVTVGRPIPMAGRFEETRRARGEALGHRWQNANRNI